MKPHLIARVDAKFRFQIPTILGRGDNLSSGTELVAFIRPGQSDTLHLTRPSHWERINNLEKQSGILSEDVRVDARMGFTLKSCWRSLFPFSRAIASFKDGVYELRGIPDKEIHS